MARIRYLKPDFFKDEDIKELPPIARLFYQGLWCFSDREGRGEDRPERLRVEIFPYENIDVESLMVLLSKPKNGSKRPFINRYETDGHRYYEILEWKKHQKPHHTEKQSVIPKNRCLTVNTPLVNSELRDARLSSYNGNGEDKENGEENRKLSLRVYFYQTYEKKFRKPYIPHEGKDYQTFEDLKKRLSYDQTIALIDKYFKCDDEFLRKNGHTVQIFGSRINSLQVEHKPTRSTM